MKGSSSAIHELIVFLMLRFSDAPSRTIARLYSVWHGIRNVHPRYAPARIFSCQQQSLRNSGQAHGNEGTIVRGRCDAKTSDSPTRNGPRKKPATLGHAAPSQKTIPPAPCQNGRRE